MATIERRAIVRLQPKQMTYVAVRPDFNQLGRLLNISINGLGFQYIAEGDPGGGTTFFDIDLFINKSSFYLQKIPCERIYDIAITTEQVFPKRLSIRRCGVQYDKLSDEQVDLLNYFLLNFTDADMDGKNYQSMMIKTRNTASKLIANKRNQI